MKLFIKESIEKVDDILVFDYVGDLINVLLNKPKPYRICYDPKNDVYGLGDAYKYIHAFIEKGMKKLGYEPEIEKGTKNQWGGYSSDSENYKEITFVPYNVSDDKWQVGGFEGERDTALYIPTGFILFNKVVSKESYIPDLYKVLKRKNLISNTLDNNTIEQVKRTAKSRLKGTYKILDEITDIMEDNGFKLTDKNYRGYDFKSYSDYMLKNPKAWGVDYKRFDDLFIDAVPGRNMDPDNVYIGEGDDEHSVYWDYVSAMSSQAAIYKELINLCKEYNIPYSTFYDL